MCEFNKQDVLTLAKTILDDPIEYYESYFRSYYFCRYCDAKIRKFSGDRKDIKHDSTCPMLIAQDIMTRMDEK